MLIFMLVFIAFWTFIHIFNSIGKKEATRIRSEVRSEVVAEKDIVIAALQAKLQETKGLRN